MTEPRIVLGCDPGNNTGIAWGFDGELVACYLAEPGDALVVPAAFQAGMSCSDVFATGAARAVFEFPKFYGARAYKTPGVAFSVGNALIREAVTLGGFKQQAAARGMRCEEILPRAWKGTLPKRAMLKVIVQAMTADERRLVKALGLPASLVHNVLDACGIVLWSVGRLNVRKFGK